MNFFAYIKKKYFSRLVNSDKNSSDKNNSEVTPDKKIINLEIKKSSVLKNLLCFNCYCKNDKIYSQNVDGYICSSCNFEIIYDADNKLVYEDIFNNYKYSELENTYVSLSLKYFRKMIREMNKEQALNIILKIINKQKISDNDDLITVLDDVYNDLRLNILLYPESYKISKISIYKFHD